MRTQTMGMASAALALYLVGLGLAFGGRSLVQRRRTGDTGLRLDAGPIGSVTWWAKLAFVAALVAGAAGPVMALGGFAPLRALHHPVLQWAGLLIALAGVIGVLVCQSGMGTSWRVGVDPNEQTPLVVSGVFGVVRNPIFTAMLTTSAGLTLMTPNGVAIGALLLLLVAIQLQVRAVEEPYLRRVHRGAYLAYAGQVGRFVPALGRLR